MDERGNGRSEAELCDALDDSLVALVQAAPHGSPAQLLAAAGLAIELAYVVVARAVSSSSGSGGDGDERVGLLCALERCLELMGKGVVDPGVALPALAMASHTARGSSAAAWAAARYELETLLPVPGQPTAPRRILDVPAASLVRRPSGATASASSEDVYTEQAEALGAAWPEPARLRVAAARKRLRDSSFK